MNMWNIDVEQKENVKSPRDIVQEQCEELASLTNDKIIARIKEYDGEYISRPSRTVPIHPDIFENITFKPGFNVQDILGENGSETKNPFVYELYITSKNTPKYKYRIFIMYYGIELYPVNIILPKEILEEIGMVGHEKLELTNDEEFSVALAQILGSKKVSLVLQKLLNINK